MKHIVLVLLLTLAVSGCAMSPEQLAASAKAMSANVACARYDSIAVDATIIYANVDKGVVQNGGLQVTKECDIAFGNQQRSPFQATP